MRAARFWGLGNGAQKERAEESERERERARETVRERTSEN